MRHIAVLLAVTGTMLAADGQVDIYSSKDLAGMSAKLGRKGSPFAAQDLQRYGNHYTMLAWRQATGSAEVHQHEADIFVIQSGEATLVTGGTVVNGHTEKPGEIRGSSIEGGERHPVTAGDIVHIPAGIPHQLVI